METATDQADTKLAVHSGLAIPELKHRGGRVKSEYTETIIAMAIGECVDVPLGRHKREGLHQMAARYGVRVKVRLLENENGNGDFWRVWKTELTVPTTVRWPRKKKPTTSAKRLRR